MSRTELKEFGEFGLIDRINENTEIRQKSTIKGIGDDAAAIEVGEGNLQLISTDMLVEGIHFDLSYVPLKHLGYKAVSVNVSDIAAMNGVPEQITVSVALSNRISVEALDELYEGIHAACENYKVDLVGGDTTSSTSGLIISVSVIGKTTKEKVAYRSNAKEGDIICVTGDLGGAYLGLQVLEREKQVFLADPNMQPQIDNYDYLVQRQLKPKARMDIIHELKEFGIQPNAMIDVSDGLASEVLHICKQSNCGAHIFEENLPLDEQMTNTSLEFKIGPVACAMNGGEDYELLFTIPKEHKAKLKELADVTAIGEIVNASEGAQLVSKEGRPHEITAQGWNHFTNE